MKGVPSKDKVFSIACRLRAVSNNDSIRAQVLDELLAAVFEEVPSPEVGANCRCEIGDGIKNEAKAGKDASNVLAQISRLRAQLVNGILSPEKSAEIVGHIRSLQKTLNKL